MSAIGRKLRKILLAANQTQGEQIRLGRKFVIQAALTLFAEHLACSTQAFVPKCHPARMEDLQMLQEFLESSSKVCVLTGAGISTESGIPDYRSEGVGLYARSDRRPVLYKEFCSSEATRRRYWARNYVGWPRFSSFKPNVTHRILRDLELAGRVSCVVTQNVDSLHSKAGSKNVIELHGTAFRVMCLSCPQTISRFEFQVELERMNPNMSAVTQGMRPDGDVDLSQEQVMEFQVPPCTTCGGILKPDIVFFGDNVPRARVERVKREVEEADSLLVLGSSLSVFSGYRIVLQAVDAGKPIAILNIGETRGDQHAGVKVRGRCGEILPKVCSQRNSR